MASQRWSMIDKTSAGMASVVVTMRQFGSVDRKTMRELLPADASDVASMEKELASLPAGTGYVWDPGPATLERHHFPANTTFDSSRTPKHGDRPPPVIAVSSELVEELRKLLVTPARGSTSGNGDADGGADPQDRRRILELEEDLRQARAIGDVLYRQGMADGLERAREWLALLEVDEQTKPPLTTNSVREAVAVTAKIEASSPRKMAPTDVPADASEHPLAGLIVSRLAELAPARLTWRQLASILGYSTKGGYFRAGKKAALATGAIAEEGDFVRAAGKDGKPLNREGAVELWSTVLPAPAGTILASLVASEEPVDKPTLASLIGYSPSGGYFRSGLALLRQNGVIIESGDIVRLASPLPGEVS